MARKRRVLSVEPGQPAASSTGQGMRVFRASSACHSIIMHEAVLGAVDPGRAVYAGDGITSCAQLLVFASLPVPSHFRDHDSCARASLTVHASDVVKALMANADGGLPVKRLTGKRRRCRKRKPLSRNLTTCIHLWPYSSSQARLIPVTLLPYSVLYTLTYYMPMPYSRSLQAGPEIK